MQKYVVKQVCKKALGNGKKVIIKTNIAEGKGINGVDFQRFTINPFPQDEARRWVTDMDFHDYGVEITEHWDFKDTTFITHLDYSSIVSVIEMEQS